MTTKREQPELIEAQAAEIARLKAEVATAYEDGRISACNAGKPGCPRVRELEAALATDAGKGYVSTEGAVEVNAVHSRYNNPSAFVATNVPYEWAGKRVLIVRKPEWWK